jgi:enoyl-CoA hydratase/carnithine racemase
VADAVTLAIEDGVAVITLNRPDELNVFSGAMGELLSAAYARCDADDDIRAVILTGAGRAFCAGADMQPAANSFARVGTGFSAQPLAPPAWEVRKPVIAAINGHAIGIGFTLAMQCDIRYAAATAKLAIPQVRRGVMGDAGAHWTVTRAASRAVAADILLTGRTFSGAEAARLGLVSQALLRDDEILGFAYLLLTAGSGTTWKQMGITLYGLLTHPEWLERVRADRALLRPAIEEALRWQPTDPMFSRYAIADTTLAGVDIPATSVVHLCFGAANRDPARWERPDDFDPGRPLAPHFGFGRGPHTCLGMHVARAEIQAGVSALLDRLPGLRLDPDAAHPTIIGMYERGVAALPVVWG